VAPRSILRDHRPTPQRWSAPSTAQHAQLDTRPVQTGRGRYRAPSDRPPPGLHTPAPDPTTPPTGTTGSPVQAIVPRSAGSRPLDLDARPPSHSNPLCAPTPPATRSAHRRHRPHDVPACPPPPTQDRGGTVSSCSPPREVPPAPPVPSQIPVALNLNAHDPAAAGRPARPGR